MQRESAWWENLRQPLMERKKMGGKKIENVGVVFKMEAWSACECECVCDIE